LVPIDEYQLEAAEYVLMKLYIIRHAESEANTRNILAGRLDVPLSERGLRDADALAGAFIRVAAPGAI